MKHFYSFYLRKIYLPQFAFLILFCAGAMLLATQDIPQEFLLLAFASGLIFHCVKAVSFGISPQFAWVSQQGVSRGRIMVLSLLFFIPPLSLSGLVGGYTLFKLASIHREYNPRPPAPHEAASSHRPESDSPRTAYLTATAFPMLIPFIFWWIFGMRTPVTSFREPVRTNWNHPSRRRLFRPLICAAAAASFGLLLYGPFEGSLQNPVGYFLVILNSVIVGWWGTAFARENFVLSRRTTFRLRAFAFAAHFIYAALFILMFPGSMRDAAREERAQIRPTGQFVVPVLAENSEDLRDSR